MQDLSGLPPTYLTVNELDPLRDEGLDYAQRLLVAGVPTEVHCFAATFHGFVLVSTCRSPSGRWLCCAAGSGWSCRPARRT